MKYFLIYLGILFTIPFINHSTDMGTSQEFYTNKVIAHRGAWKKNNLPQNSIASLREAIKLKCEGSEFDVWMTADSILVVNHDPTFFDIEIETSTYDELLEKSLSNGEKIPTVKAYITEGMKQQGTKLIMEIKPSVISKERGAIVAEKSLKLVQELGAQNWVDYISFDYDMCRRIIEKDPQANVAYLTGNKTPEELKTDRFFGLDYHFSFLKKNPHWIDEAHDLGLTVNAWTVNQKEDMQWLLDRNVRFISTDEPELLFELISKGK